MSACMAMRSLVLAAGRGGGGEQRSRGAASGGNGGGRGRGRRGRGSGRGSGAPDGPDTASRREGRAGYGYKNAPMERRGPSSGGRGRASRGRGDGQSNARGARGNNPSPNTIDEAGACDTMPQALMSLELGHPRCPMCAQTFASGGTRARHLALCCPDLIDPVGWRRGDERVVRRCASLRHPKSSFRWAVLSRRFGWSDDDGGADGGAEDTAVHDDEDTAVGSSLGGIVSSRRREAARSPPDTDASTRPAPMTAKATARALRVDLATVTKLVRHEIRDVPLQPERIPLHVVYEDECMMAVAKPSGVMTYPAHRLRGGSVVSRAVHHLNMEAAVRRGEDPDGVNDSSSVFSGMEPIAVHRLDLETSGLLLLAKDKRTATELQSQFEGRRVRKTYLAVCAVLEDAPAAQKAAETRAKIREEEAEEEENDADEDEDEEIDGEELGVFDETDLEDDLDVNDDDDETDDDGDEWELDEFDEPGQVRVVNAAIGDPEPGTLRSDAADDGGRCVRAVTPDGKPARTEYQCLSSRLGEPRAVRMRDGTTRTVVGAALVLARPLTGRTHQVRLHLAHAALPIIGDALYGVDSGPVAESIEAFRKTPTGGGASREEREAAARRRVLFSSPSSSSSSSSVSSDDGADSSSDDSSAESPCTRLALHAWNVEALHPRALVPLRLAVDMPPDMSSLAKSLGLNVEYVTLGRAAEAAARAGGAGARNALRSERREAAKGRVRRMVARKGRSEE